MFNLTACVSVVGAVAAVFVGGGFDHQDQQAPTKVNVEVVTSPKPHIEVAVESQKQEVVESPKPVQVKSSPKPVVVVPSPTPVAAPFPTGKGCAAINAYADYEVGKASAHDIAVLRLAYSICVSGVSPDM